LEGFLLTNYAYIAFYLVACILLAVVAIVVPIILRLLKISPSKPDKVKTDTYECGMETTGRSWVQFNFRYYVYALMLIALDVLVVFLYPWAAQVKELGAGGFVAVLVFIFIVVIGYIYAWKKRMLEWR
jgi:NADH-quinone oxidoreductase subunit A